MTNYIFIIVFSVLLLYSYFYKQINSKCNKIFSNFLKVTLITFILTFSFMSIVLHNASHNPPKNNADAVIVLGAGLRGENVSTILKNRLDTAAKYYFENPDTIIIVSGGQGKNEIVTEAYAMKKYLLTLNIPDHKIIEEDLSTRTIENFEYSKKILDEIFIDNYTLVHVTTDVHVFRAGLIAKKLGIETEGLGAPNISMPLLHINQYFYEYFALIKYFIFDYN